jgi:hypothetical protein
MTTGKRERLDKVYAQLIDETENPDTVCDKERSELLQKLLEYTEYILDGIYDNPLDLWFD